MHVVAISNLTLRPADVQIHHIACNDSMFTLENENTNYKEGIHINFLLGAKQNVYQTKVTVILSILHVVALTLIRLSFNVSFDVEYQQ